MSIRVIKGSGDKAGTPEVGVFVSTRHRGWCAASVTRLRVAYLRGEEEEESKCRPVLKCLE